MSAGAEARADEILIIKLGALGDAILALGPIAAIRRHHHAARITLLTTAPFAALFSACPAVDRVWIDEKPALLKAPFGLLDLRRRLRGGRFSRVYDLQTSDRSSFYFYLLGPGRRPEWSGIARGCSHPHDNPLRDHLHTIARQRDQLGRTGIAEVPPPDLSWLKGGIDALGLDDRPIVLLVPGGAAHRPEKRWPVAHYGDLAGRIAAAGLRPLILGGAQERPLAAIIARDVPTSLDLTGRTDFGQIASLARRATAAIGNDTGPMHIVAAAGCPATVLFSAASDPDLTRPAGPRVTVLRRERLADLTPGEVAATLELS